VFAGVDQSCALRGGRGVPQEYVGFKKPGKRLPLARSVYPKHIGNDSIVRRNSPYEKAKWVNAFWDVVNWRVLTEAIAQEQPTKSIAT